MRRLMGAICALAALHAGADTLGEVRAAVSGLSGKQPARATFSVDAQVKTAGRFANDNSVRAVSLEVAHDAGGVSMTIPQSLVEKSDDHTLEVIRSIHPMAVIEALNFRDSFLHMLENATVTEEKRVVFRGRPAKLLVLKLNPRPQRSAGTIQFGSATRDDRLSLWLGDDNFPIAAERTEKATAGFLFIKGTAASHTNYLFARTPDRLILSRMETSDSASGMGQNAESKSVQTLTLH